MNIPFTSLTESNGTRWGKALDDALIKRGCSREVVSLPKCITRNNYLNFGRGIGKPIHGTIIMAGGAAWIVNAHCAIRCAR